MKKVIAIIPARYGSSRFPGKPLANILDKPMIQWTYEQAQKASNISDVFVATDDQRIFDKVIEFGGKAIMTRDDHESGTDRIAEAIENIACDLVVNIQGDEPTIPYQVVEELVEKMLEQNLEMGTVAVPIERNSEEFNDPNCVKVVTDANECALYFSRASIPFQREGRLSVQPCKHWGIYAYTPELINKFIAWPTSALENCEKLEQLRALENGTKILVIKTNHNSIGVDTPEDVAKVEKFLK